MSLDQDSRPCSVCGAPCLYGSRCAACASIRPRFAMVGSQKCGTTSAWYELNRHRDVFMDNGRWFTGPTVPPNIAPIVEELRKKCAGKPIAGLMYPDYALDRTAPAIRDVFGSDLKIIMLVRDPVRRAVSNYWMEFKRGNETRSITDALWSDGPLRYLPRGFYAEHLHGMAEVFGRKSLLILRTEDLAADTRGAYRQILEWIGAAPFPPNTGHTRHRVGDYVYDLPNKLEDELYSYYAIANQRLHDDFGVRIDDWRPGS